MYQRWKWTRNISFLGSNHSTATRVFAAKCFANACFSDRDSCPPLNFTYGDTRMEYSKSTNGAQVSYCGHHARPGARLRTRYHRTVRYMIPSEDKKCSTSFTPIPRVRQTPATVYTAFIPRQGHMGTSPNRQCPKMPSENRAACVVVPWTLSMASPTR